MATKLEKPVTRETTVIEKMVPLIVTLRANQTMGFKLKFKQEEIIVDIETLYRFAKQQAITGNARVISNMLLPSTKNRSLLNS